MRSVTISPDGQIQLTEQEMKVLNVRPGETLFVEIDEKWNCLMLLSATSERE